MPNFLYILCEGVCLPGKTADAGTDSEQYIMVAGHNGAGKISGVHPGHPGSPEDIAGRTYRPDASGADDGFWWNIHEDMGYDRILNHVIWREPISEGQTHVVNFTWMDQNSSVFIDAEHVAAGIGDQIAVAYPDPIVIAVAGVLDLFALLTPKRDDEFLGQFTVSAKYAGGNLQLGGVAGNRSVLVDHIGGGGPGHDNGAPGFRVRVGTELNGRTTDTTYYLRCFVRDQ